MLTTIEVLWSRRDVQLLLVFSAVVAVVLAAREAARGRAWIAPAALRFACGLIVSVTLRPGFGPVGNPSAQLRHCWRGLASAAVRREAFMSPGGALNVMLFVPFGALAYAVSRQLLGAVVADPSAGMVTDKFPPSASAYRVVPLVELTVHAGLSDRSE